MSEGSRQPRLICATARRDVAPHTSNLHRLRLPTASSNVPIAKRGLFLWPQVHGASTNVQHLTSNKLDEVCRVTICTIQRLYSTLHGEELEEDPIEEW